MSSSGPRIPWPLGFQFFFYYIYFDDFNCQKVHANQACIIPYIYRLKLLIVGTMADFYLIIAT